MVYISEKGREKKAKNQNLKIDPPPQQKWPGDMKKSEMHRMTPIWTAKSTLYTLITYPWGPNFRPFRSTTSILWDTRSSKIGNAPSDPKPNLNT